MGQTALGLEAATGGGLKRLTPLCNDWGVAGHIPNIHIKMVRMVYFVVNILPQ